MNSQNEQENEKNISDNSQETYEEINEKKTSKLGYILLILMVFFVIGVGETIFSDLKKIPEKPISPSSCILNTINNLENLTYLNCPSGSNYVIEIDSFEDMPYGIPEPQRYNNLEPQNSGDFNEIDKKFGLDEEYNNLKPQLQKILSLNKSIEINKRELRNEENNIQKLDRDYDLSLQEKIAEEDSIMNKDSLKNSITKSKAKVSSLENEISSFEKLRNSTISEISAPVESLKQNYKKAQEYYQNKMAWYELKIFLLTLIFVLPFFAFSVFYYLRLKRKNSPYTIILTASTTAFSILFLQVVLTFLYDILPMEWLTMIFKFFLEFSVLRYVIYYGSVILVIGIFGGIVFYIQKRVFSPAKVATRRLKDKKCPNCSFPLDPQHNFCPDCGLQLKEKCEDCGKLKIKYLSHCPNCGKK